MGAVERNRRGRSETGMAGGGGGGGGGGGHAPPPKQDELQPHPAKDQLPNIAYCITSPPPWREFFLFLILCCVIFILPLLFLLLARKHREGKQSKTAINVFPNIARSNVHAVPPHLFFFLFLFIRFSVAFLRSQIQNDSCNALLIIAFALFFPYFKWF